MRLRSPQSFFPSFIGVMLVALAFIPLSSTAQLRVVCWGNPTTTNVPANLTNIRSIAAGYNHCLVLLSNGTVVAWGDNSAGQTNGNASLTNIMAIAAGQNHNVALRSNGTVFAWGGFNNHGELNVPAGLSGVKAIAAGGEHTLALRTNGTVVAWGNNFAGQTNVPAELSNVVAITAGDTHSMALRNNGTIVAWGDDGSGQTNTPANATNIFAFAAGYHHNIAVRSNGTLVAWELNVYGESVVPGGLSNVIAVGAGNFLSVAVRSNGTVMAWGQPFDGQTNVPPGLTNVIAIAVGSTHVMALTPSPVCSPTLPDFFECRQTLAGSNLSFISSNIGATRESGEPQHHTVATSNSIWFEWTAPFSGGLVFTTSASTSNGYFKPLVAIYSGNNLTNLTQLATNSTANNGSGGDPIARAALTVTAGQNVKIVVDGTGQGILTNTLTLSPPPNDDTFATATTINGVYYITNGSFLGASREASEPTHGDASLGQTLWWNWTAPTNGPNPLSVRLMTDAVSFPPGVGIYTGSVVTALSPVTFSKRTNGMTSDVVFDATPGVTYRIALAGKQHDSESASPLIGTFDLRLNTRALALTITNLTMTTNGNGSVPFQADARVQNFGSAAASPLRVSVSAISGLSTVRALSVPPVSTVTNLVITNVPGILGASQTALVHISGTVPAPNVSDASTPIAYGVYADLQEQPATNKWFTVDQSLVTYDKWPGVGEIFGPGGGVIRFDPGYPASPFSPIIAMAILGSPTLTEGRSTNYTGKVTFSDNTTQNFTNTAWSASQFTISSNGIFAAGSVVSNTPVLLTVPYYFSGFTFITSTNITVLKLQTLVLTNLSLLGNTGLVFTVSGTPGRTNIIEATTNLALPSAWIPLATNIPASGTFMFTNFSQQSFPLRLYRAREQ